MKSNTVKSFLSIGISFVFGNMIISKSLDFVHLFLWVRHKTSEWHAHIAVQNQASRVGGGDVKTKMPAMTVVIMEQTMIMVFMMMLAIACSLDEDVGD